MVTTRYYYHGTEECSCVARPQQRLSIWQEDYIIALERDYSRMPTPIVSISIRREDLHCLLPPEHGTECVAAVQDLSDD
jgi:hypothetical protein